VAQGFEVISSLAGRVREPRLPDGQVRIGGFGGADGLAAYLVAQRIDVLIDATHPFAARMTQAATTAAAAADVPAVVLRRPPWSPDPADDWRDVPSLVAAARMLPDVGERVFLTTGRQGLNVFAGSDLWFLVRAVESPEPPVPQRMRLLLERGPFTVDGEIRVLREHDIQVLVTKNSGGAMTAAKLTAARELGVPVVMVSRSPLPAEAVAVEDVDAALSWAKDNAAG
jgi:precorrin-6A/cobalt-precorrin-6A reductase